MSYDWAIRLAVGLAAVIAAVLLLMWASEAPSQGQACVDEKTREDLRTLTLDGIDAAYKDHVAHLFDVWVRDASEQPKRAKVGMQASISAYIRAKADTLKWNPPAC